MIFPRFLTISLVACFCLSLLPAATASASSKIQSFEEASAVTDQRVLAQMMMSPSEVLDSYYASDIQLYEHLEDELYEMVMVRLTDRNLLLEVAMTQNVSIQWRKTVFEKLDDQGLAAYIRLANERLLTGWYEFETEALLREAIESIENRELLESLAAETKDPALFDMLVTKLRYGENGAEVLARLQDRLWESDPARAKMAKPSNGLLFDYGMPAAIVLLVFGLAGFGVYRLSGNEGESVLMLAGALFCALLAYQGWTGVTGVRTDLDFRKKAQPVTAQYVYTETSLYDKVTVDRNSGREISRSRVAGTPHWIHEDGGTYYSTDARSAYYAAQEGLKVRVAWLKYAHDHDDLLDHVRALASELGLGKRKDRSFRMYCVPGQPGSCRLTKDFNWGGAFVTFGGGLVGLLCLGWLGVLVVRERRRLEQIGKK